MSSIGISDGPADAPVHVVELADLECPFCKRFHETLKLAKEQFPDRLKVTWIHHPLNGHRFARPAARAAECAHAAGRFQQFVAAVFAKQDSLGLKSWGEYAADAGVEELTVFRACAADTIRVARVEEGLSFGTAIGLRGTPASLLTDGSIRLHRVTACFFEQYAPSSKVVIRCGRLKESSRFIS